MFIHICIDLWKHRSRASLNCIQCPTKAAKMVAAGCRALHRLSTLLFLNDHLDRLLYLSILMSATLRLYYSAADCVKEAETMPLTRAQASSTILRCFCILFFLRHPTRFFNIPRRRGGSERAYLWTDVSSSNCFPVR